MAKLNDFIAQVKSEGLMRNNRYIIQMPLPTGLLNTGMNMQKVLLLCDSVSIPGVTVSTTPARTFGEIREMPYEKIFAPANMSFYVDNKMEVKKLFDNWQAAIQHPIDRTHGYYANYTTNIIITILDVYDNQRYEVTLHEAYLKDLSPIQLDAANRDVMKMNVAIQYKYWTATDANASVSHPDNRGFFEKLFDSLFGDSSTGYFDDFNGFQSDYNSNTVTPQLGGLNLSGASYRF